MDDEIISLILKRSKKIDGDVTRASKLIDDLGLDSFDGIILLCDLDEYLGINVEEEDFAFFTTVGDVIDYCKKRKYP